MTQWLVVSKPSVHKRSLVSKTLLLSPFVSTIRLLSTFLGPRRHFRRPLWQGGLSRYNGLVDRMSRVSFRLLPVICQITIEDILCTIWGICWILLIASSISSVGRIGLATPKCRKMWQRSLKQHELVKINFETRLS